MNSSINWSTECARSIVHSRNLWNLFWGQRHVIDGLGHAMSLSRVRDKNIQGKYCLRNTGRTFVTWAGFLPNSTKAIATCGILLSYAILYADYSYIADKAIQWSSSRL